MYIDKKTKDVRTITATMNQDAKEEIFLQTTNIPVHVRGQTIHLRDLLDSAWQNNLIKQTALQFLKMEKNNRHTRFFLPRRVRTSRQQG